MYALLEEEHGLAKRAMGIYDRAASSVQDKDKFEVSPKPEKLPTLLQS